MIKTLRKIWKSDWGKAALVGVGLVGYGAYTSAGNVVAAKNLLRAAPEKVGFLADIQNTVADVVTAPIEFGQVLATSGYGYLTGANDFSTFKGGVQSAFGMVGDSENLGTLGKIGSNIYKARNPVGGPPRNRQDDRIRHSPVKNIASSGNVGIQKAGQWKEFAQGRLASNTINYARGKKDMYGNIISSANNVARQGPNISFKEASLNLTKPSFRYTA